MSEKQSVSLPATVEKIIASPVPGEPETAHINIDRGALPLYKEIRIENAFVDKHGDEVKLKPGAKVEITVDADPSGTVPMP